MPNLAMQESGARGRERLNAAWHRGRQVLTRVPLRRWKQLAAILIVLWLAHSLAQLFWLLAPQPDIPPAQVSESAITRSDGGAPAQSVDIASLRALTVFGEGGGDPEAIAEQQPANRPGIEDQAVDTQLSLVLRGIIGSSDTQKARAIIADAEEQAIYAPGDEIENYRGVKVAKVLDQRVILDNKGQYESLWLYKKGPGESDSISVEVDTVEAPERSRQVEHSGQPRARNDSPSPRRAGRQRSAVSASLEEVGQNISDVVAFNIHREDGQIKGYRIRPGRNPQLFNELGLEAGDVVTAVNGTPLDNPGRVMEIYRNLSDATSASLQIERGDEMVTVDVQLD